MTRFALSLLPVIALLAACGQQPDKASSPPAEPVAAAKPPAGTDWTATVSKTPDGGYLMGNPAAPIKLVEYGSRACPFCAQFAAEGAPELQKGPVASGKVSYEFRDYPIHGALDIAPILLGHCVDDAAFFPMLDQMMANQQTLLAKEQQVAAGVQQMQGKSPNEIAVYFAENLGYLDFVKQRGVPEAKARACLADKGSIDKIAKQLQVANDQYSVASTPTFIINGKVHELAVGEPSWVQLQRWLKAAGA